MDENKEVASKYSWDYKAVSDRIVEFRSRYLECTKRVIQSLDATIQSLNSDLCILVKCIRKVMVGVTQHVPMWLFRSSRRTGFTQGTLAFCIAKKRYTKTTGKLVIECAGAMKRPINHLDSAWALFGREMSAIETCLAFGTDAVNMGYSEAQFHELLKTLPQRYTALSNTLEKYSIAVAVQ